jgi:hypothetical protein
MPNENESCYDCKWYNVDSDCSQIKVCKNFKRKSIDIIVDNHDCMPLDIVERLALGLVD